MWGANEAEHDNGAMLLFFARGGTTGDETQKLLNLLNNPANVAYFRTTATLGGAMVAQAASRATLNQAKVNRTEAWRKLRLLLASGQFLELVKAEVEKIESGEVKLVDKKPRTKWETFVFDAKDWLRVYAKKFKGVPGAKAPKIAGIKAFVAWRTCPYTWFGTAISLLVLSALSQLTATETDGTYFLMLGSFGALMALHYGAPNSPLAQPRNALGGCTLAATISILFYYLSGPEFANALPKWAAQALAPATAIAVSQRFNAPPARRRRRAHLRLRRRQGRQPRVDVLRDAPPRRQLHLLPRRDAPQQRHQGPAISRLLAAPPTEASDFCEPAARCLPPRSHRLSIRSPHSQSIVLSVS